FSRDWSSDVCSSDLTEATGGKPIPIIMPQAGNSMEEGTIVKWLVKEGDRITKGQVIFEIETDKANMEVEATDDGRVAKIVAKEEIGRAACRERGERW